MTNPFRENQKKYYNSINIDLPFSTNSSIDLAHYVLVLL
ncbi:hypothetical protein [Sphingobacterium alimentarium]